MDLEKYAEIKCEQIDTVRKKVALKAYSSIVKKTPVDTGRARGNWLIGINQDRTETVETENKSGSVAGAKKQIDSAKGDETIYISNNLPYISKLEYGGYTDKPETEKTIGGFSKQAPMGMVGLTMGNIQRHIKEAIDESNFTKDITK